LGVGVSKVSAFDNDDLSDKPLVICVGAQKAATTTLYTLMKAHTEVCVSKEKETGFFYREEKFKKGYEWHLVNDFLPKQGKKLLFEADPNYMFLPISIENIYSCNPSAKIIVMLRNPVLRAYSHFMMMRNEGYEEMNFHDAYLIEKERLKKGQYHLETYSYLARGFYAHQIENIISKFPKDQILFVVFENFIKKQQEEYGKILEWLNLTHIHLSSDVKTIPQVNHNPLRKYIPQFFVRKFGKYRIMKFIAHKAGDVVSKLMSVTNKKPKKQGLSQDRYRELLQLFHDDIRRVESLTGLDLSIWNKHYE
jgi:hypothetical protein